MKCFFCESEMRPITTSLKTGWGDYEIEIKGVKALRCTNCAHEVYDPEETRMIQNISAGFAESKMDPKPDILDVNEVSDLLKVTNQTIYNMIKDGRLPAFKVGKEWRFSKEKVLECLGAESGTHRLAARGPNISNKDQELIEEMFKK